ncbi:MAG: hypothetical protein H0T17_04750 [Propionibacteriales bacterium]|nr:hypothetical protein [Propionibacteriales bacterium]
MVVVVGVFKVGSVDVGVAVVIVGGVVVVVGGCSQVTKKSLVSPLEPAGPGARTSNLTKEASAHPSAHAEFPVYTFPRALTADAVCGQRGTVNKV